LGVEELEKKLGPDNVPFGVFSDQGSGGLADECSPPLDIVAHSIGYQPVSDSVLFIGRHIQMLFRAWLQ
jgi:hypothetical protein